MEAPKRPTSFEPRVDRAENGYLHSVPSLHDIITLLGIRITTSPYGVVEFNKRGFASPELRREKERMLIAQDPMMSRRPSTKEHR
ncbi:hypothetical protein VTO42DRAFT_4040 [Malbranchea cinnamomea]